MDGAYLNQPAPKLSATSDGGFLYCSGGSFSPSNVIKIDTSAAPVWSKFVYQRSSIAIEIQDSGTLILGNGPVYGVKTYPTFNPQIGIITLDSATHSVAPCLYDNFTSVDGGSVGVTSITCSAATGGTMEARHPVVSIFTLDSYDGCVAFMGSVEENHAENYVTAYPNPNPGVFTLEMKTQMENYSATITDITGRTIYNKTVTHAAHQILDISDQPNGIYFLTVIYGTKQYRTKVVLVK